MASKFYAVKKGIIPGIYRTWSECEKQVKGFSGAIFKSFTSLDLAKQFIGTETVNDSKKEFISQIQVENLKLPEIESLPNKFYAVKKGLIPGIYRTWSECEKQVKGFSGAIFKSFTSLGLAKQFIGIENKENKINDSNTQIQAKSEILNITKNKTPVISSTDSTKISLVSNLKLANPNTQIEIYTDGSHEKHAQAQTHTLNQYIGIGAYCCYDQKEYYLSDHVTPSLLSKYEIKDDDVSNPTAEFIAFSQVLKRLVLVQNKLKYVFYIDYVGVQKWMSGEWKAKKSYIQKIKKDCEEDLLKIAKGGGEVEIKHIPGHSGIKGNEMADLMAKNKEIVDNFI